MIRCFGIRHHGPGSARSLERALRVMRPDCVLIEGPPDADPALPFAAHEDMRPPVALLVHAASDPSQAVFYPFARFSPEWVALRWALAERVPVRFIDLPIAHQIGVSEPRDRGPDPLVALAGAAGFDDADLFWERLVEVSDHGAADPFAVFLAIADAMRAVRDTAPPPNAREAQREAWMRQQLRAADKALFQNIAVIVGAWHVPALDLTKHTAKADGTLLKGLPKTKTEVAWIPWTAARLAAESGYGAGVDAPGWYAHLFDVAGTPSAEGTPRYRSIATAWAVRATRFLRDPRHGEAVGPADALEVVRAADALAALRELAAPGLGELREALLAVSCAGVEARLTPLRAALEIGFDLGAVPAEAPATPLRRDVEATMRHLRLKPLPEPTAHEWDLRKPLDRERVVFLHRLALLEVPFGRRTAGSGMVGTGTFKELWTLAWDPAFEVELALAARWGHTVGAAAAARLVDRARTRTLPELADDLMRALDAELDPALDAITSALEDRAAVASDVLQLGRALPPLARVMRYSDVKDTDRARVEPLFDGLFRRYALTLPAAAAIVDDAGAEDHCDLLDALVQALALVARDDLAAEMTDLLSTLAGLVPGAHAAAHARIQGRATRLLVERKLFDGDGPHGPDALQRLASLALGPAVAPTTAAAWIEGLVAGAGVLLEPQRALWAALDRWLGALSEETFVAVLPILRRAFAHFTPTERRRMGALLQRRRAPAPDRGLALGLDPTRVALLRPVLVAIYRSGLA